MDKPSMPVVLSLDLVRGESTLIFGLDVMQHENITNMDMPTHIRFQHPTDTRSFSLLTFITYGHAQSKTKRLRLEIAPQEQSSVAKGMAIINNLRKRTPLAVSKNIYHYTHAPTEDIKNICRTAGIPDSKLVSAIDFVDN